MTAPINISILKQLLCLRSGRRTHAWNMIYAEPRRRLCKYAQLARRLLFVGGGPAANIIHTANWPCETLPKRQYRYVHMNSVKIAP